VRVSPETARGNYRYLCNGEQAHIEEHYCVRGTFGGDCQINSWRRAPGVYLAVEALVEDGLVSAFEVSWQSEPAPAIKASYRLCATGLQVWRRLGDHEPELEGRSLAADVVPQLSPLMRIYTGPVIARLLDQGGEGEVVVPFIGNPQATDELLRPHLSTRRARVIEESVLLEGEGGVFPCRVCEYTGDQYAPGTHFYLDEDNRLLRYQWQQDAATHWDVRLVAE